MEKFFKFKRLKIVEQIGIVFFFAVLIPMTISGFIINNVNQQAMRHQLRESAVLIANMVAAEIDFYNKEVTSDLQQVAHTLDYFPTIYSKKQYLKDIKSKFSDCESLEVLNETQLNQKLLLDKQNDLVTMPIKISDGNYLVASYKLDRIKAELFHSLKDEKRQIYILMNDGRLLASHNYKEEDFSKTMKSMPKKVKTDKPVVFGDVKNQPIVYVSRDDPEFTVVVNTTESITEKAINYNSFKIILCVVVATLAIIFVVALYTYYLYINIRQLFKGIIAISKGNYSRQIRLLTTAFTPYEILFLASEFNRMASDIRKSYLKLKDNNIELKQLNEFRSNLIDTVSHELRTPLTSIQGYTSRLLRQDIEIDEETKQKSLRVIKEQSEHLKRLIDDLLTIPDIEGMRLYTEMEPVWIQEVLEDAKLLIRNKENKEIVFNISKDFPQVNADKVRLIQVLVNLMENAVKYANPNTKITIDAVADDKNAQIFVKNECDIIPAKKLKSLFEKFTRIETNTTRTTRGTGLGLFIVKGLVEAMKGQISLSSNENCGFCVEITMKLAKTKASVQ